MTLGEEHIIPLKSGTEVAFRELFDLFNTRLCFFASQLLLSEEEAEDVVQEAFVKLWERKNDFNDISAIKAFLYITVKHSCLNINKHYAVKNKYVKAEHNTIDERTAMHSIIESEVLENVHRALKKLPEGCQQVMQLSYFKGLKNKEIAQHLHISINTVKTQKLRGLRFLRGVLKVLPFLWILLNR